MHRGFQAIDELAGVRPQDDFENVDADLLLDVVAVRHLDDDFGERPYVFGSVARKAHRAIPSTGEYFSRLVASLSRRQLTKLTTRSG